ncbi:hypothetical protein [Streptomyces sp. NPDC057939]|uniref:hypothetical protein n=1 Tax=Streptomyces sp. NPDC057939 TaxID=3346284 RepID=UPI0036E9370B
MTTSFDMNTVPLREEGLSACPPPWLYVPAPLSAPSEELLVRARAGWERFVASFEEASDG